MADQKISAMPAAATPLTGAELVPLVQSGGNVSTTVALFGQYARDVLFNRGAFSDTTSQTGSITVPTAMTFNSVDVTDGVTIASGSRITVSVSGVYNIQFSAQLQNTDNAIQTVTIWPRINGTNVTNSAGTVSLPARESAGVFGKTIQGWNYFLSLTAGQYVQLMWLPTSLTVSLPTIAATALAPASASIIVTVNQVG
jgi:hypothetical protein